MLANSSSKKFFHACKSKRVSIALGLLLDKKVANNFSEFFRNKQSVEQWRSLNTRYIIMMPLFSFESYVIKHTKHFLFHSPGLLPTLLSTLLGQPSQPRSVFKLLQNVSFALELIMFEWWTWLFFELLNIYFRWCNVCVWNCIFIDSMFDYFFL